MKALLFWPDQPVLSLLVLLVIAVPFLYAARAPMQDFIGRLTRALSNPLRLGSHWLARTANRLHTRNREVLFAHGGRELKLSIEREFERVTTLVERDLQGYPAVQRKLMDEITHIEEDYKRSSEVPPPPPEWVKAIEELAKIKPNGDGVVERILADIRDSLDKIYQKVVAAVPPRLRGAAQHPEALPAVLALGQPDADAGRAQHHRAAGQRREDRLQRRQARRHLRHPLGRRARPDQLGFHPAVHLRPGDADRLRRRVRQLQADLAADVGDGRRRRLRDGAPAGVRSGGPGDHPVRDADGPVPDGDPALHQPVPARQRDREDAPPADVGVAHDPAGAGRRGGGAGGDARPDHLRRRGLEADPRRRRRRPRRWKPAG